ncbi:rhomboid family intramembrane serine protease [Aurantibacter sp.]|uniref:rhomboid family intramembrane serine protease n=1 Tax=Aurantibacter sp. TaxID=2807103 RepID=UPI0035C7BB9C
MKDEFFDLLFKTLSIPIIGVVLLWLIFSIEIRYGLNFNSFGIYPREFKGLVGIICSPFIHSNISHLYSNTIPLLVLGSSLYFFYPKIATKVVITGVILSGLLTWSIGRPSFHIGASGLIYVLFSFIFFKGILTKHYRLIALSLVVVFLYGSMIWYTIPIKEGVSWEGHLSGFVVGLFFALVFNRKIEKPKLYEWEQPSFNAEDDPFLRQFDENGYFFELEPEVLIEEVEQERSLTDTTSTLPKHHTFIYKFKPNKLEE